MNKILIENVDATISTGADFFHVPNKTGYTLASMYISNWQAASGFIVRGISMDNGKPVGFTNVVASADTTVSVRCIWIKD